MDQRKIMQARALRAKGWTLERIAQKLGVTRQHIHSYVKDVKCPIDHRVVSARKRMKALWKDPVRREEMAEKISQTLTAHYERKRSNAKNKA